MAIRRTPRARDGERWGALATFLLASFYLWLAGWLVLWVAVPTLGLGWEPIVVSSGSMGPLIHSGDVVLIEEVGDEPLAAGSVITFEDPAAPDRLTTHRIVGISADGEYRTRGDANQASDSIAIPHDAVRGVGRLLVPFVGLPALWLSNTTWLFFLWLLATLLAVVAATHPPDDPPADEADEAPQPVPDHLPDPARGVPAPAAVAVGAVSTGKRSLGRSGADRLTPARIRAWTPLAGALAAAAVVAIAPFAPGFVRLLVLGVPLAVLLLDPRGPELRVGRWIDAARRATSRVAAALRPGANDGSGLAGIRSIVVILALGLLFPLLGQRSDATFTDQTSNTGNEIHTASSWCGSGGSATLTAVADTYVEEDNPDHDHGASDPLILIAEANKNHRTLIRFDLPADIADCTVTTATLRTWPKEGSTSPAEFEVLAIDVPWTENVGWQDNITASGSPVPYTLVAPYNDRYQTADVRPIVQSWASGSPNYGFMVRGADETVTTAISTKLTSREGSIDQVPQLYVEWGS